MTRRPDPRRHASTPAAHGVLLLYAIAALTLICCGIGCLRAVIHR